jgi:PAS domain S-box-containing protein
VSVLETSANTIAAVLAAATGLAVGSRHAWRWVRRTRARTAQRHALIEQQLPALMAQMATITAELRPNGGGSIKDAIGRIEKRQLVAEKRTWALIADTPTAIFEADADGRIVNVNTTYTRWTGRAREDLLGLGWLATISDPDRDRVAAAWRSAVAEDRACHATYTLLEPATTAVVLEARAVRDEAGNALAFIGTLRKAS